MKNLFSFLVGLVVSGLFLFPGSIRAQERVPGRLYVVSADGEARRTDDGRFVPLGTGESYAASRTTLETPAKSRVSAVLSNNTGLYLAAGSSLEIDRFDHAPFVADPNRLDDEPAISTFEGRLRSGSLALCFPRQVFGSNVLMHVEQASLNLRGSQIEVDTNDTQTSVYVIDGTAVVFRGANDHTGSTVTSGQLVTIVPGAGPQFPRVTVAAIPAEANNRLTEMMAAACLPRHTVFFARPEDPRRVVTPPPTEPNPTVSLDRLP